MQNDAQCSVVRNCKACGEDPVTVSHPVYALVSCGEKDEHK